MNDDSDANYISLSKYIDLIQSKGRYTFTRHSFIKKTGMSDEAFMISANRLSKKKRIIKPIRGFYFIVPLEYSNASVPVVWYIDDLMNFLNTKYYVSLLSAASIYGAGHQQPQRFQVVVEASRRDITVGNQHIGFYSTKKILGRCLQDRNSQTGYYKIGLPEQVAVDLVFYYKHAGYFSHIATVLSELWEQLDSNRIVECAQNRGIATAQRLGYILDCVAHESLTSSLGEWVQSKASKYVLLRPDLNAPVLERSRKWKLNINDKVELDIDT